MVSIIAAIVAIALVAFGAVFAVRQSSMRRSSSPARTDTKPVFSKELVVYSTDDTQDVNQPTPNSNDSSRKDNRSSQKNSHSTRKGHHSARTRKTHELPRILSQQDTTLRVYNPQRPRKNQIISAAASKIFPSGVLRRITEVSAAPDKRPNEYNVDTKPAPLTAAIKKVDQTITTSLPVTSSQISALPAEDAYSGLDLEPAFSDHRSDWVAEEGRKMFLNPGIKQDNPFSHMFGEAPKHIDSSLQFSGREDDSRNEGMGATGKHQLSVRLKVENGKTMLDLRDHIVAKVSDAIRRAHPVSQDVLYYFNAPVTLMVGKMPLVITPTLTLTVLDGSDCQGITANLVTNIDHTIGARYETGKPIKAIDEDHSSLDKGTYARSIGISDIDSRGPLGRYFKWPYLSLDSNSYAAFLSAFKVNGLTLKTGIVSTQLTNGKFQGIDEVPSAQKEPTAFTLPGIQGKMRGRLSPEGRVTSSVLASVDNGMPGLDAKKPVTMEKPEVQTRPLKSPALSCGKIIDRTWMTGDPDKVTGFFGNDDNNETAPYYDLHNGPGMNTEIQLNADGSFGFRSTSPGTSDWLLGEGVGKFEIPADASPDKPFMMHLVSLKYDHPMNTEYKPTNPDNELKSLIEGGSGSATFHTTEARGFYRPESESELLTDFMFYPKGTAVNSLPEGVRDEYADVIHREYMETTVPATLQSSVIAPFDSGKPFGGLFTN